MYYLVGIRQLFTGQSALLLTILKMLAEDILLSASKKKKGRVKRPATGISANELNDM
jgi:hypothetical protein